MLVCMYSVHRRLTTSCLGRIRVTHTSRYVSCFLRTSLNWSFGEKEKFIFFLASGCEEGQVLLDCVAVFYMSLGGPPV